MRWLLLLAGLLCACPEKKKEEPRSTPPPAQPAEAAAAGPDWQKAFKHTIQFDGTRSAVVVGVTIEPGYHAYAVGETIGKPMNLSLDETSAYALAGEVKYPAGETKDLPIGKSVIVEGAAEIVAPVQKKAGAADNKISGTFRWQVCTEEACDRPRTQTFSIDGPNG